MAHITEEPKHQSSAPPPVMSDVHVIATNFKFRLSGVTSTIIQLVPLQRLYTSIVTLGPGLPDTIPNIRWWQLPALLMRPAGKPFRIFHARRNPEMLAGIILKKIFRAPLRLVFTSASQRHHSRYTRWLIRQMDSVIATSAKGAAYLKVPNTVVMHGIDCDRFSPATDMAELKRSLNLAPDQKFVGCFGRIRHQKGTDLFVDTMISLLPSRPDWTALIAGRTTPNHAAFEEELKMRIKQAGLEERIRFIGEKTDIPLWYKVLSLYVAPQRWEGFGLTPLEAMASGVPVVATDVGAFSELIDEGQTGTVIPLNNLDAMITATGLWMDDAERREKGSKSALNWVTSRFRLEGEVENLQQIYESLWAKAHR